VVPAVDEIFPSVDLGSEAPAPTADHPSGAEDSSERRLSADTNPPASVPDGWPAVAPPPRTHGHAWVEHKPKQHAEVLTVSAHDGQPSGLGTGYPCAHGTDQFGGRRCIRCCIGGHLSYVWRNAAGGSPGSYRYLCGPCLKVYEALGLVGAHRGHVENMANRGRPVWVVEREAREQRTVVA